MFCSTCNCSAWRSSLDSVRRLWSSLLSALRTSLSETSDSSTFITSESSVITELVCWGWSLVIGYIRVRMALTVWWRSSRRERTSRSRDSDDSNRCKRRSSRSACSRRTSARSLSVLREHDQQNLIQRQWKNPTSTIFESSNMYFCSLCLLCFTILFLAKVIILLKSSS